MAVGGIVASQGAKKGAKTQAKAGEAANEEQARQYDLTRTDQLAQYNLNRNDQLAQYEIARGNQAPWLQAGRETLGQLTGRLPELTQAYTPQDLENDPGYQFQLAQGLDSIRAGARGNGTLDSGATLKALMGYGQGLASTRYGEAFNRDQINKNSIYNMLAGISGTGQTTANQLNTLGQNTMAQLGAAGQNTQNALATAGQNSANNISAGLQGIGNVQAAGQVGSANALGGAISGGWNTYNQQQNFNKLFGGSNVQNQIF